MALRFSLTDESTGQVSLPCWQLCAVLAGNGVSPEGLLTEAEEASDHATQHPSSSRGGTQWGYLRLRRRGEGTISSDEHPKGAA